MSTGLGTEPVCWHCPHSARWLPCEFCDCPTSTVGAVYAHEYDVMGE